MNHDETVLPADLGHEDCEICREGRIEARVTAAIERCDAAAHGPYAGLCRQCAADLLRPYFP
jgi:hypothetical protein